MIAPSTVSYKLHHGDNLATLKTYPDNHFDSVITDPPYGIKFLGKDWDSKKATETTSKLVALQGLPSGMKHTSYADDLEFQLWLKELFKECLRVLKPGGHMLAFSASRTYHHTAMAAQTAGFEIRDQIMWIYSSGFPKSQDVGKSIERSENKRESNSLEIQRSINASGPKTNCPKCDKTLNGSNQTKCEESMCDLRESHKPADNEWAGWGTNLKPAHEPIVMARKPTKLSIAKNVQKYNVGAINVDASRVAYADRDATPDSYTSSDKGRFPSNVLGDIPDYQKYFYCPKVSRKERHVGFTDVDKFNRLPGDSNGSNGMQILDKRRPQEGFLGNNHPTVKPVALMTYLINLVTPKSTKDYQCKILDPFMGSGSTGLAATALGHEFVGCDLDAAYIKIAATRIEAWNAEDVTMMDQLFDEVEDTEGSAKNSE